MRFAVTAGSTVLVGLALAFLLTRLLENSVIFFPARYPVGVWEPQRLGVAAEDVYFETADGLRLHGWWFEARGAIADAADAEGPIDGAPVLLWSHGNAGNLTGRARHAQVLADEGVSVFVFDYRGYGRSEGSPNEPGIYEDAEAAYRYLSQERGIEPGRIVLLGRSLGSAPAALLATKVPHAGTVLISPLPSSKRMARRMFFGLPIDLFTSTRFPVATWAAERRMPLLVIHGDRDNVIPVEFGREVYDAAAEPKELLLLPGAGHNDILDVGGQRYVDALVGFARVCVARYPGR